MDINDDGPIVWGEWLEAARADFYGHTWLFQYWLGMLTFVYTFCELFYYFIEGREILGASWSGFCSLLG